MGSINPRTFEQQVLETIPDCGIPRDETPGLFDWRAYTNRAALSAATTPNLAALDTKGDFVRWDHGDTSAKGVYRQFNVGREFAQHANRLMVRALARKTGATDENADLALQAQIYWFTTDDSAFNSLATPAKATLAAASAWTGVDGFEWYDLDIGARLEAEGAVIESGATAVIVVGPDDTVGTAAMTLDLADLVIAPHKHACYYAKADRWTNVSGR